MDRRYLIPRERRSPFFFALVGYKGDFLKAFSPAEDSFFPVLSLPSRCKKSLLVLGEFKRNAELASPFRGRRSPSTFKKPPFFLCEAVL